MSVQKTKQLAQKYFNSWQEPSDFDAMRECLADDVVFDAGSMTANSADELMEMVISSESPWEKVEVLGAIYEDGQAALFYDGIEKATQGRNRIAEMMTIEDGKIKKVVAVMTQIG